MAKDTRKRKNLITINNPDSHGFSKERIIELLMLFHPAYWCLSYEIAKTGTLHVHIFMYTVNAVRFSTIKNRFPTADIQSCDGTCQDCVDYVRKGGKWEGTEKAETSIVGTFEEWGQLPPEGAENSPELYEIIQDMLEGKPIGEIIVERPKYALRTRQLDELKQTLDRERAANSERDLTVLYLFGNEAAISEYIHGSYPARDVCRIFNYNGGNVRFDNYRGQAVLVLQSFFSSIPFHEACHYLSPYCDTLPARFYDRTFSATTVILTSTVPPSGQYRELYEHQPEAWQTSFYNRIHHVIEFGLDGTVTDHK